MPKEYIEPSNVKPIDLDKLAFPSAIKIISFPALLASHQAFITKGSLTDKHTISSIFFF